MKSPFQLRLSHRYNTGKNNIEGPSEADRVSNDRLSKVKFLPRGNGPVVKSSPSPPSVIAGTTTGSQSSLTSGATPTTVYRSLRTSSTKRYSNKTNRDDDNSQSQNSVLLESNHRGSGPKMHHYPSRHSGANDHPTRGGSSNQSGVCSPRRSTRQAPSFMQVVAQKGQRKDDLALTCLAVGAAIDSCMNEEPADIVGDAILAYACGYDDDDDDDDTDEEDVDVQKRDDSPPVYESYYQVFSNGIGLSMEQAPRHDPVKVETNDHIVQDSHEASQPSLPETVQPLTTTPEDVREDVDVASPYGNVHRKELQVEEGSASTGGGEESTSLTVKVEESGTVSDNSGGASSDDCSGSSIQTSQNGQELVLVSGENNVSSYTQSLLRALGYLACHETEWPEEDDISFNPCQAPAAATTATTSFKSSDTPPAIDADASHQNDHSTSLPKLEQEIPGAQPAQGGKREKKSLFSRRFARGIRTKRGRQVEPKTLHTSYEASSEPPSKSPGIDLEPGKIETTSSVIVPTLEPTIVESASC